jgi:hypothetical protein
MSFFPSSSPDRAARGYSNCSLADVRDFDWLDVPEAADRCFLLIRQGLYSECRLKGLDSMCTEGGQQKYFPCSARSKKVTRSI